jgi:DNA-sulfur modification-associated
MPLFNMPVPAIRGHFGKNLLCFQTTIPAKDFKTVLGHDPRNKNWKILARSEPETANLYEYLQRTTNKARRDDLKEYIRYRMCQKPLILGAFPAVSIGFTEPAVFTEYNDQTKDVGVLLLPNGPRVLLDGLGRVTAALDLIDAMETKEVGDWFTFPCTFYLPKEGSLTKEELGQLFHDFNFRQVHVSEADAIALDQSDLHIRMTARLGQGALIQRHGGLAETATLGGKATEIVTQKHLLKFVRGALEGLEAQDSDKRRVENPRLVNSSFESYAVKLEEYLVRLEELMLPARFGDRSSIHLTSGGWQVLGLIFHDLEFTLQASGSEREDALRRLALIDWSKFNTFWIGLLGEGETDPVTGRQRLGKTTRWGRKVKSQLLDYVREQCGIRQRIAELQQPQAVAEPVFEEESQLIPA